MIKSIEKDKIIVDKEDFNLVQTLECGQVFSYFKESVGKFFHILKRMIILLCNLQIRWQLLRKRKIVI